MKKYLIISFLALLLSAVTVSAATTDFIANGNINIAGGMIILDGSRAESWTYDASDVFTVTNTDSDHGFSIASTAGLSIRVSNSSGTEVACVNNSTPGTSYVVVPLTSGVSTITTSAAECSSSRTAPTRARGGSGGATSPTPPTPLVVPATPTPALPALVNASPRAAFNRVLVVGSAGQDVKSLQQFLNGSGFVIAVTGPGSVGGETTTFGRATKAALIKFQIAKGIIQSASDLGAGTLGPKTRAKINELGAGAGATASVVVSNPAPIAAPVQVQSSQLLELLRLLRAR